jgi:hypothetical protein
MQRGPVTGGTIEAAQGENWHLAEFVAMSTFHLQSHYIWQLCADSLAMSDMPVSIDDFGNVALPTLR